MSERLLVFAKRPAAGAVMTRLTPPLSPEQAASLYEACVDDVLDLATSLGRPVIVCYAGGDVARAYFTGRHPTLPRRPQADGDLGARMAEGFASAFGQGVERVVLIGTDLPTLPAAAVDAAFERLSEADAVLGPADDGGYFLIGIRNAAWPAAAALFTDIAWSTPAVLSATLARAEAAGLTADVMSPWYDVDDHDDLARARADARPGSRLAEWLKRLQTAP